MQKIVSLCKRRGFIFPGSQIYGGLANTWDYGPLGVELKKNIKQAWWKFFVKSRPFNLADFLRDDALAKKYEHGTLLLFRLAPYDYHWYHFPCDGVPSEPILLHGELESVNPMVYKAGQMPLEDNERQIVLLQTEHVGTVAMVTVGARMVGRITQKYIPNQPYKKGDEMGYF